MTIGPLARMHLSPRPGLFPHGAIWDSSSTVSRQKGWFLSAHLAIVRSRLCLAFNSSNRLASLPKKLQRCNCQSSDLLPKNANCLVSTCQSNSVCEVNTISQRFPPLFEFTVCLETFGNVQSTFLIHFHF